MYGMAGQWSIREVVNSGFIGWWSNTIDDKKIQHRDLEEWCDSDGRLLGQLQASRRVLFLNIRRVCGRFDYIEENKNK